MPHVEFTAGISYMTQKEIIHWSIIFYVVPYIYSNLYMAAGRYIIQDGSFFAIAIAADEGGNEIIQIFKEHFKVSRPILYYVNEGKIKVVFRNHLLFYSQKTSIIMRIIYLFIAVVKSVSIGYQLFKHHY